MCRGIVSLRKILNPITKKMAGQRHKSYEEQVQGLGIFARKCQRIRGDQNETFQTMKRLSGFRFYGAINSVLDRGAR